MASTSPGGRPAGMHLCPPPPLPLFLRPAVSLSDCFTVQDQALACGEASIPLSRSAMGKRTGWAGPGTCCCGACWSGRFGPPRCRRTASSWAACFSHCAHCCFRCCSLSRITACRTRRISGTEVGSGAGGGAKHQLPVVGLWMQRIGASNQLPYPLQRAYLVPAPSFLRQARVERPLRRAGRAQRRPHDFRGLCVFLGRLD